MKVLFLVFREVYTSLQTTREVTKFGWTAMSFNLQTVKVENLKVIYFEVFELLEINFCYYCTCLANIL